MQLLGFINTQGYCAMGPELKGSEYVISSNPHCWCMNRAHSIFLSFLIAFQVLFTYYDILYYFQFSLSSVYVCERVWLWCRHIVPQCEQGSQMTTSSVSLCLHFDWDTISCCEGLGGQNSLWLLACFWVFVVYFVYLFFVISANTRLTGPLHPGFHLSLPLISPWEHWAYRCVSSHVRFYMGAGDSNSGPHACLVSTLPTELCVPQPLSSHFNN